MLFTFAAAATATSQACRGRGSNTLVFLTRVLRFQLIIGGSRRFLIKMNWSLWDAARGAELRTPIKATTTSFVLFVRPTVFSNTHFLPPSLSLSLSLSILTKIKHLRQGVSALGTLGVMRACRREREREREEAHQKLGARQAIHIHKSQAYRPLSNKQRVRAVGAASKCFSHVSAKISLKKICERWSHLSLSLSLSLVREFLLFFSSIILQKCC